MSLANCVCMPLWRQKWKELSGHPSALSTTLLLKIVLFTAVSFQMAKKAQSFPMQFQSVLTTRESQCSTGERQGSLDMSPSMQDCLPVPWLIPPCFSPQLKWECSGQPACLATSALSQREFVFWASWGRITAAHIGHSAVVAGLQASVAWGAPPPHRSVCWLLLPNGQCVTRPTKIRASTVEGRGGSIGRQGQKYTREREKNSWHQCYRQSPCVTVLCYWRTWEALWDSVLCSWLTKSKGLELAAGQGGRPCLLMLLFSGSCAWGTSVMCHSQQCSCCSAWSLISSDGCI